jgi:hypothetical protein
VFNSRVLNMHPATAAYVLHHEKRGNCELKTNSPKSTLRNIGD